MVQRKQTLEEFQKASIFNQLDMYWFKGTQGTGKRSSVMWHAGSRDLVRTSTGTTPSGRGDIATLL
jgi:hypothetical protein